VSVIVKGSARIASDGTVTQLGAKSTPDEIVTADDVKDTAKLAKVLTRIISLLAALRRAWAPRTIDFEDVPLPNAGGLVTLQHNFGGRVRWWVVDNIGASSILLQRNAATTADTLVLSSNSAMTATIRIQEAG